MPLGLQAVHPDAFVVGLLDSDREAVLAALKAGRARYRSPPLSALELLDTLERQGLPDTAAALRTEAERF